ncbi:hypothetical protein GOV05_01750 [Candidatus Woesearchaeota archaeon]|nr:hypothetical protein [Candidatus Woesearchaeota archaeon]
MDTITVGAGVIAEESRILPMRLNTLLKQALKEKEVSEDYIEKAGYLPVSNEIRGFHRATDVLIYSEDDFREVDFYFDKEVGVELLDIYIRGLQTLTSPKFVEDEYPIISTTDTGNNVLSPIEVLTKGYWGWFSTQDIHGEVDPISEAWVYEPSIKDYSFNNPFVSFYAKKSDGDIGWVTFPIKKEETENIESLLK